MPSEAGAKGSAVAPLTWSASRPGAGGPGEPVGVDDGVAGGRVVEGCGGSRRRGGSGGSGAGDGRGPFDERRGCVVADRGRPVCLTCAAARGERWACECGPG